jgi:hypothetical protein
MNKFSFKNVKRELNLNSLKKQFLGLIKDIQKRDILLFFLFPILITLLMLLPSATKEILQLNIKEPSEWQYFTQSFVHNNWEHLSSNLFGYFLYSILLMVFVNKCNLKKEYYKLFVFIVISLPILNSYIQVKSYPILLSWLPNLQHSTGSSGIVSALAGVMIIFWAIYFAKINKKIKFDVRTSSFFLVYVVFWFVLFYSRRNSYIWIVILILLFILLITLIHNFKEIFIEISKESKKGLVSTFILIITPLLFFVTPLIIFPNFNNMFRDKRLTDFFMHYIGIVYGIIVTSSYFIFMYNKK